VTITPVAYRGNNLNNVVTSTSGTIAYYGVQTETVSAADGGSVFDSDSGYALMDVRTGQPVESTRSGAFYFDVSSSSATASSGGLVVTVSVGGKAVPIAAVGESVCSELNCQDTGGPLGSAFYLAAKYNPGSIIRIGIYPKDVCATVLSDGNGCTADGKVKALAGSPAHMPLLIEFKAAAVTGAPTGAALDSLSTFAIRMQVDKPTIGCPDKTTVYFPGDEEIILNSAGFYNATGGTPAPAPAQFVYVVADENKTPATIDDSFAGFRSNQNVRLITIGDANAQVTGFVNTTTGDDHQYAVSFLIRDAAGMLASPSTLGYPGVCRLQGVQTSNIQGFLSSSKCFIATAAFRSVEAGPVELLREFRDHVLFEFAPGRSFVEWYYSWSPQSAEWLVRNPVFRAPVLVSLIPLQIIAFISLHSVILVVAAFLSLIPVSLVLQARRQERQT